ncbi:hypothetical protein [Aureivirga sp. CE67]|uniref:hypothetical protein n=1 Tax=Aureivirga sp. CE67 TaxID=1788983 RepID=UPI0018C90019|nr:hypothetical protein [Aureivirga sp. CE67]
MNKKYFKAQKLIKINQLLLLVFCIIFTNSLFSQIKPAPSFFDLKDFEIAYYYQLKKVLYKEIQNPIIKIQLLPNSKPESLLVIEKNEDSEKYFMTYTEAKEKIWYNKNWKNVEVSDKGILISKEVFEWISKLFKKTINGVSLEVIDNSENFGFTHEDKYFISFYESTVLLEVFNPKSEKPLLVEIIQELIKLIKIEKELEQIPDSLKAKIELYLN